MKSSLARILVATMLVFSSCFPTLAQGKSTQRKQRPSATSSGAKASTPPPAVVQKVNQINKNLVAKERDSQIRALVMAYPSLANYNGLGGGGFSLLADYVSTLMALLLLEDEGSQRCAEMVNFLLAKGASKNLVDYKWWESLRSDARQAFVAAGRNMTAVLQLKISLGFDPNTKYEGFTPLISASMFGSVEAVKLLLSLGADPNITKSGSTALDLARIEKHSEVVRILEQVTSSSSSNSQSKYYNVIYKCKWGGRGRFDPDGESEEMTTFAQGKDEIDAGYNGIGQFEVRERCKEFARRNNVIDLGPRFKRASLVR